MDNHIQVLQFNPTNNPNRNLLNRKGSLTKKQIPINKPKPLTNNNKYRVNQVKMNNISNSNNQELFIGNNFSSSPPKQIQNRKYSKGKPINNIGPINKAKTNRTSNVNNKGFNNKGRPIPPKGKLNTNDIKKKGPLIESEDNEDLFNPDNLLNDNNKQDEHIMNTIKLISENRLKFHNTNKVLREIGKIANNPALGFLLEKDEEPHEKLSNFLSDKMIEQNKQDISSTPSQNINDEDAYYENLQKRIKAEIKAGKKFDFNKLSEKDRKLLAQRKLYNRLDKNTNSNNNNDNNINKESTPITNEVDKETESLRQKQRELLLRSIQSDDVLLFGDNDYIKDKDKDKDNKTNENDKDENKNNKEDPEEASKPTARGILERVLKNIEYKNEMLINHNEENKYNRNKKKK